MQARQFSSCFDQAVIVGREMFSRSRVPVRLAKLMRNVTRLMKACSLCSSAAVTMPNSPLRMDWAFNSAFDNRRAPACWLSPRISRPRNSSLATRTWSSICSDHVLLLWQMRWQPHSTAL